MSTLDYYNTNAVEYDLATRDILPLEQLTLFTEYLPIHGRILDVGCGSGRDTIYFKQHEFTVTMLEPSEELYNIAHDRTGEYPVFRTAQEIDFYREYDGVWACSSLVHVPLNELPHTIKRIHRALMPNGIFYCSFKKGYGEITDSFGRHQTLQTLSSIVNLCSDFKIIRAWLTRDQRTNKCEWVNIICRKVNEL